MLIIRLPLFVFCIILTACSSSSEKGSYDITALAEQEQVALQYMQDGQFIFAAEEYVKLGKNNKRYQTLFQLKAAAAYFEANEINSARTLLESIVIVQNNPRLSLQKQMLQAKIALVDQQPEYALALLPPVPQTTLSDSLMYTYFAIRADAYSLQRAYLNAIIERSKQYVYASPEQVDDDLDLQIWQDLLTLDQHALEELQRSNTIDLIAWSELVSIYLGIDQNGIHNKDAIQQWRMRYPEHPALERIVPQLLTSLAEQTSPPKHIALLLPFTGALQSAANAIRDGFAANWYSDAADRPKLTVMHADSLNILDAYTDAVQSGADFIVGPLEKTAIARLLQQAQLKTRLLLLNTYDGNFNDLSSEHVQTSKGLFQLSLSPEVEARGTAEKVFDKGLTRGVVIHPANSWGRRSAQAFKEHYESLGGTLIRQVEFELSDKDLSKPVKYMLDIEQSKQRAKLLQSHIGRKIYSEQRRRQDISFIYILAPLNYARQLMPHIYFQRANDIPVFASSLIHAGDINPERDNDLNRIIFPDIPWLINPNYHTFQLIATLEEYHKHQSANSKRLYALGYDAYGVIKNIAHLLMSHKDSTIDGATGKLFLGVNGEILRSMSWAQFVNGRPERLYD